MLDEKGTGELRGNVVHGLEANVHSRVIRIGSQDNFWDERS